MLYFFVIFSFWFVGLFVCLFVFSLEGARRGGGALEVRKISYFNNFGYVFFILELIIELRIERPWDNELENKISEAFKLLSDLLESEVRFISPKREC